MPKIVDPQARRRDITDAVFRIVRRDGLEHASLRNIAAEAGLAIGSVRHYFTDHNQVMEFAMRELTERTTERILARVETLLTPSPERDRRQGIEDLLGEFLPLDRQRRLETTVWLSFLAASRHRPELQPYARRLHDGMRMIIRRVLERSTEAGRLLDGLDIAIETERLAALLDGLTLAAVHLPDALDEATAVAVVHRHIDSLLKTPG